MTKKDKYLQAHSALSDFMKPLAQKHCSPCQHHRGAAGCCAGGPYIFTKIERELNENVLPLNESETYCAYLKIGKGCILNHKSGTCLGYLCGAIHRTLTDEEREMYWKLREELGIAIARLEGLLADQ